MVKLMNFKFLVVFALILVSGCVTSLNPIQEESQRIKDPLLAGVYVGPENETFIVLPPEESALYKVIVVFIVLLLEDGRNINPLSSPITNGFLKPIGIYILPNLMSVTTVEIPPIPYLKTLSNTVIGIIPDWIKSWNTLPAPTEGN